MEEERREGRRDEENSANVIMEEDQVQVMQGGREIVESHRMDSLVEDKTGEEESRKSQSGKEFTQPRQRRRRVEAAFVSSFERKVIEAIETSNCPTNATAEDPDMQFLQRLDPKCRELTKLKIHQLIFEAEFNCEFEISLEILFCLYCEWW